MNQLSSLSKHKWLCPTLIYSSVNPK